MCNNGFGGGNCCWIIILLIIIWCCCGNGSWGGNGCGCGCGNNRDPIPTPSPEPLTKHHAPRAAEPGPSLPAQFPGRHSRARSAVQSPSSSACSGGSLGIPPVWGPWSSFRCVRAKRKAGARRLLSTLRNMRPAGPHSLIRSPGAPAGSWPPEGSGSNRRPSPPISETGRQKRLPQPRRPERGRKLCIR